MRTVERRLLRLERRVGDRRKQFRVLLRLVSADGSTDAILAPDGGGGWRPATETEIAGAVAVMEMDDWAL